MNEFFNSNFFSGLATIITGSIAFLIYWKQKREQKISAARVLLTEIRIAEERIDQISDKILTESTADLPSIFPTNSWKKYAHLFIRDFDQDELKLINSFYHFGGLIEEFAQRNNNYFWIVTEERARITTQKIAGLVLDSYQQDNPDSDVIARRDYLNKGLDAYNTIYSPKKTLNGMKDYLSKIQKITTTSCGIKFKKIAKLKS